MFVSECCCFFLLNAVGRHEFSKEVAGRNALAVAVAAAAAAAHTCLVYCTNTTNPHGPSVARVVFCALLWRNGKITTRVIDG